MNRHGTDIQTIKIDMRFIYVRCDIHIHRYDNHISPIRDRYDIDIRFINDVNKSTWH